jgi:3',5'-cyclic AMP phosphodiesterase CpdA
MRISCILLIALGLPLIAHAVPSFETDVETAAKPYTSLNLNNDPDVFRFAIISDNAGGPRWGIFEEAIAKLNLLQPEFVITTGDLIEGYEDDADSLNKQWARLIAMRDKLEMPFFHVPGNHDQGRPLWSETFNAHFGKPFYHFVYKNVLFLCLATNTAPDNSTGISQEQVEYAKQVLAEHKDVRYTLVFQHKPLWNDEKSAEWGQIQAALKGRPCTVFAGHTHNYLSQERDGISFITLATTGGGTQLSGIASGEFDEIAWVTMTKSGPRVANLVLDGILDKDVRTEQMASQLRAFDAGQAVKAAPLKIDAPAFESAESKLVISNPCDAPLRIKVLTETAAGVRVEPSTVSVVIPAKDKYETALRVTSDAPVPAPKAQPIVLHWKGYYDSGKNTRSIELGGQIVLPIDAPFEVPAMATSPTIDGSLAEWGELPYVMDQPADVYTMPQAWKGPRDGSLRFAVGHDDQFLYVAIQTIDDQPTFDGWKYWEDFVMLLVDQRATEKDDPRTAIFSTAAGPKLDPAQIEEYAIGKAPDGIKTACKAVDGGFAAEFAIPLASLNAAQGGNWQHVRLNIGMSDFDSGDTRDGSTILYWRPQWERKIDFNSGLFIKK